MADYWYCTNHHRVEQKGDCPWNDQLGPYASEAEAEHALDKVAERNREADAWDDED